MAKRLVKKGITLIRDGARVRPQIGKLFDFTKEEIADLEENAPTAIGKASEADDDEAPATKATKTAKTSSSAEGSQAGARGGRKASTANQSDDEAAGKKDDGKKADDDL